MLYYSSHYKIQSNTEINLFLTQNIPQLTKNHLQIKILKTISTYFHYSYIPSSKLKEMLNSPKHIFIKMKQKSQSSLIRKFEKLEPIGLNINLTTKSQKFNSTKQIFSLTSRIDPYETTKPLLNLGFSKTVDFKRKTRQERKYNLLMEKISSVPSIQTTSENIFRKRVKKNILSLQLIDPEARKEELEEKEVVNEFSSCVKGKMFCISKPGQQFRKTNLTKRLKVEYKQKCKT